MTDHDKPKSAKERLEAAKAARAAATDADVVNETSEAVEKDPAPEAVEDNAPETGAVERENFVFEPAETPAAEDEVEKDDADKPGPFDPPEPEEVEPEPAQPEDEPPHEEAAHEEEHHEGERRSIAALILQWLVIFVIGGAAALWAGPRIAPHLPAWAAPVATFLTPGASNVDDALAALRADLDAGKAELAGRISSLEAGAGGAAEQAAKAAADLEARLAARIDEVSAQTAAQPAAPAMDGDVVDAISKRIAALEAEVASAASGGDGEAVSTVLESEFTALSDEIDALKSALDGAQTRVAALESGEAATAGARSEAERIRRAANLDAALSRIEEALSAGKSFETSLGNAVSLSGQTAPEALSEAAESGIYSSARLMNAFPQAARKGYGASVKAEAGAGFIDEVVAQVTSRIGGRPVAETAGDDAGAVLSRIEARLKEGRVAAAADEAAGLPAASAEAMSAWLGDLNKAAAARRAFTDWRSALSAN